MGYEALTIRYRFGPCTYLPGDRELRYGKILVQVPLQESKVLLALLEHAGEVVPKSDLADLLWPGEQYGDFDRAIHNLVSKLRRIHPEAGQWIQTVPKTGYKFVLAVVPENGEVAEELSQISLPTDLSEGPLPEPSQLPVATSVAEQASLNTRRWWTYAAILVLFAIALGMSFLWWERKTVPTTQEVPLVIGVLPLTGGASGRTEASTLRDQISDALASVPNVEVRAAHTLTAQMAENPAHLQQAVSELKLDLVLAGQLDIQNDTYTLSIEVIQGKDETHRSSLHYQGATNALGAIPDRIVTELAPFLRNGQFDQGAQHALGGTTSQQAYDLAFRAAAALTQRSKPEVTLAAQLYRQAVDLDPRFAKAWSGLAESELVLANFGSGQESTSHFGESHKAANRALQLSPENAQAHSTIGLVLLQNDWKLAEAESHMRAAIESNPGLAANHLHMAVLLTDEGRFAEASSEIQRARDSDPAWPIVHGTAMYVDIMGRHYDKAIADAQFLVRSRPDWSRAHEHLGWAFWYAGKHTQAIEEWHYAALLDKNDRAAHMEEEGARILKEQGVRAYAEFKIAAHRDSRIDEDYVPAEWYAFSGDVEHTLDELEKMLSQRDPESLKIPWNPAYDFLRNMGRYTSLIQHLRMETGLPS